MARVALTGQNERFALVDDADYVWLSQWRWHFNGRYAARGERGTTVYMHRQILGLVPGDGKHSDHVNGDPLDNRRVNLRVVTREQNMQNRKSLPGTISGYRGVTWIKSGHRSRRWMAQAGIGGKTIAIGYFATELDAAAAAAQWRAANMSGAVEDPVLLAHPVPPPPPSLGSVRYRQKAAEVERRWKAGESLNEIADALGTTRNAVGSLMVRLRREGYDLPFRRPGF